MMFDDFFIDQIKSSVNIVDVVQGYVRLVKKGQNYQALCPFHSEKTPSFSVSGSKQIFKCFGCGAAGDVFAFVSRIEGLSFPETVKLLAEKNGISIPDPAPGAATRGGNRNRLLELMSSASAHYQDILAGDPDALDFLHEAGILDATRRRFGLGCFSAGSGLREHLHSLDFSDEEIRMCGLDRRGPSNGGKAIVLPLTDIAGKALNFAYLPVTGETKEEISAPDTSLFQGGSGFFGLHAARQAMREKDYLILLGRSMDGMLLAQKGIPNVAACIGRGLSGQQARILGRNTKKVIINHVRGSVQGSTLLRSAENLIAEGFSINVAELSKHESLPLLLEAEGLAGYIGRLKKSSPLFDYLLDLYLSDAAGTAEGIEKSDLLDQIKCLLRKVPSRIARSEYAGRVTAKLGITMKELEESHSPERKTVTAEFSPVPAAGSDSISRTVERDSFLNFTPDLREKIRADHKLSDIIRRYQRLDPRNHIYRGRCPFHTDSAMSLHVSLDRQLFKCLGCGAGGELFSYIAKFEELSLPEAILSLAVEDGTELPDVSAEASKTADYRCRLLGLMKSASDFFIEQLQANAAAITYLQERGISDDTRDKFDFGYAPAGNRLISAMKGIGYSLEELEAAGLTAKNDSGEYYDKFRNRIILSIKDLQGRIIAFGGRALGDSIPKYLNSPETILYNKRGQLFGLSDAKKEIAEQDLAILVEGYFDCVIPSQFGISNIVASLGTSLTEQQVNLLGGFARNVIVSYDPDSAGQDAAARSINMFLSQGFRVKVMQLPEGKDPDALIIEEGVEAYRELLDKAIPFIDFMVRKYRSASASSMSPEGKQKIVSRLIPSLLMVPNQVERAQMAARAATLLKLDEKLVLEEMRRYPRPKRSSGRTPYANPALESITLSERILLAALLDRDRYLPLLDRLERNLFEGSRIKAVYETILGLRDRGAAPSATRVWDALDDTDRDILEYWAVSGETINLDENTITNSIADLQRKEIRRQSREIQEEIAKNESGTGDPEKRRDLLRRKERLSKQTLP